MSPIDVPLFWKRTYKPLALVELKFVVKPAAPELTFSVAPSNVSADPVVRTLEPLR